MTKDKFKTKIKSIYDALKEMVTAGEIDNETARGLLYEVIREVIRKESLNF